MPVDVPERAALAVARSQHGVIRTGQLAAAGLSRHAIAHRVRSGWLRRRHRGVFIVGPIESAHADAMAAVLALGEGALLSHYSAAMVWEIVPPLARVTEVTLVRRDARGPADVRVHRIRRLHRHDAARHQGIPVTSPARTLLDLATQARPRDLARATDEARIHHLVTDDSLEEQFTRYPNHRGTAALRRAIPAEPKLTRSEAERRFLELIRAARLPDPVVNVRVGRHEVDFLWPEQRLVVEVDGYAFHSSRTAFERDRLRDAELQAAGYRVIRVTWRQIDDEREALVAILAAALTASAPGRDTYRRGVGTAGAA